MCELCGFLHGHGHLVADEVGLACIFYVLAFTEPKELLFSLWYFFEISSNWDKSLWVFRWAVLIISRRVTIAMLIMITVNTKTESVSIVIPR